VLRQDATWRLTCGFWVVELRGLEPLTPCMPCHPHPFTRPSATSYSITSALLNDVTGTGFTVLREAKLGIAADSMLTDTDPSNLSLVLTKL
jgi:hypothetical protein